MTKRPTIGAIIINHNREAYLSRSINDALEQTVPFDDILILDDCSSDNSIEKILALIAFRGNARLVTNDKNLGIILNMKKGIELSNADYVFLMSSDDNYSREMCEISQEILKHNLTVRMICGSANVESDHNIKTFQFDESFCGKTIEPKEFEKLFGKKIFSFFGGANLLHRRSLLCLGAISPEHRWYADWLAYHLMAFKYPIYFCRNILTTQYACKNQYSSSGVDTSARNHVVLIILERLKIQHPFEYEKFKRCTVVPLPNPALIFNILVNSHIRGFLTLKLLYKCAFFGPARLIGSLFSQSLKYKMRKILNI